MNHTIAAIATPYGSGGIGIIRISGPEALPIACRIFFRTPDHQTRQSLSPEDLTSHRVFHGYIAQDQSVLDEVLLIPMKGPASYTGEDVVEIQAHAGAIVLRSILDLVLSQGASLPEPGEFTRRAFLNGRIDLSQAEAVADIINARSDMALRSATDQNLGKLGQEISQLRDELVSVLSHIEAAIDFSDDVPHAGIQEEDRQTIDKVITRCQEMIQQHKDAGLLQNGIRIAICGAVNVGKSSLMNCLTGKEKSIVTPIAGTTRDPVEEHLNIRGIPLVITDTAGIRETSDLVEIIGVEKAKEYVRQADIILLVKEPRQILTAEEYEKLVPPGKKAILVVNKTDLLQENTEGLPVMDEELESLLPVVQISALKEEGIKKLKAVILDVCTRDLDMDHLSVIPNVRHKMALEEVTDCLLSVKKGISAGQEEDFLALDIRQGIDSLGTITGETASLDILDTIFSRFCVGK